MKSNVKNIVTSVVMVVLLLGLSLFSWFKPVTEFSLSERRLLAKFPVITADKIFSGKFMTDFESYSVDQFPLRDTFRTWKALANKYIFAMSDNNGIYYKDGYLSKTEYPMNEDKITLAGEKFKFVYDKYLKDANVNAYLAVVPDKNYFLNEGERLSFDYDEFAKQMQSATPFLTYIDIFDTLSLDSFYKTDTHWRQEEIIGTAKKIATQMGVELKCEYTENTLKNEFFGVYHGQSALPIDGEELKYLTNSHTENAVVFDYQNNKEMSVYDMEKAIDKDPYEMFLGGSLSLITIENENAATDKHLVLFRDSFGSSIAPLFIEGYKKITVVDIRYIQPAVIGNFIDFENADVLFLYSTLVLNNSETIK